MDAPYIKALPTPFFCLIKKLTVIGINGYTQGVRQVAKPMPKAIKKKDMIESSFFLGSVLETVAVVAIESAETTTGAETASFKVSIFVATTATVLATLGVIFSSC